MSFDDLDKKIRDAADMHQPSYNEKAWTNMEHMLDKQLPQKKNNYRRYFFWFIAFLISTPLLMMWLNRDMVQAPVSLTKENNIHQEQESVSSTLPDVIKNDKTNTEKLTTGTILMQQKISIGNQKENSQHQINQTVLKNNQTKKATNSVVTNQFNSPVNENIILQKNTGLIPNLVTTSKERSLIEKIQVNKTNFNQSSLLSYYNKNLLAPIPSTVSSLDNILGKRKSFLHKLSFTLSAGPSVSSVNINNPGRMTTVYGAGIKYAINNKWSLGTGFFINKKIYAAGKDDYRPPASFWNYYTNLLNVDADCDVFEIPLTVSYSIKKTGRHEWIASTGISNYIMKKETYNYSYKDNAGQIQNREWSVENKNMHHFSALTLSAGYKHHINNRTSILIEPNIKIPLKGVGYGKVKFYNAGTLVTLQVNPFIKK